MKKYTRLFPLMMLSVAAISLAACDDAAKTEETADAGTAVEAVVEAPVAITVTATEATSFATAADATTGAVFLKMTNSGTEADKLIGATTAVSSTVEIHENVVDEATGTMQMRKVDGVEVAAGQTVELSATGNHIMLMGLAAPLVEGSSFDVTLDFEKGADVVVPVSVTAAGVAASDEHTGHEDHATPATTDATTAADVASDAADVATDAAETATDAAETAVDAAKDAAEAVVEEVAPEPTAIEAPAADAPAAQ